MKRLLHNVYYVTLGLHNVNHYPTIYYYPIIYGNRGGTFHVKHEQQFDKRHGLYQFHPIPPQYTPTLQNGSTKPFLANHTSNNPPSIHPN